MSKFDELSLADRRKLFGGSTRVWARLQCTADETSWLALSGAPSVDFNFALCWGDDGREAIERAIAAIATAGVPGQVMVCDRALGHVQALVDAGWTCIAAMPFMRLTLHDPPRPAADVRVIDSTDIDAARTLIEVGFGLQKGVGTVAMPDEVLERRNHLAVGVYEDGVLVGTTVVGRSGSGAVAWSFAIAPQLRGRGHARQLAIGTNYECYRRGVSEILCISTAPAEHLYRTLGFEQMELWQVWSRRRWVLASG